ncbi:CBO0543 family protein [Dendrosporobacter sp. 1207_IL3150]|uniref:CBO0543 family protein n=1 Tax=Dendrosporobacter sp. 1207_IL3150 TaxID=3084054 RepID=UPI002FDA9535
MDLFFMITFFISWIIWFILADKSRWREILPVCVLASGLGMLTDDLTEHAIMYWEYFGEEPKWVVQIADDLGIYVVVTYLFIQWLQKEKTLPNMLPYWFIWTGLSITIEYIHIATGHMTHQY